MNSDRIYGYCGSDFTMDEIEQTFGKLECDLVNHIRELLMENAALKADERLHIATQRAAKRLPEGFEINIIIEKDAGYVMLCNPEGNSVDFTDSCESLANSINNAIDFAIEQGAQDA